MEMSFADEETVMEVVEALIRQVWTKFAQAPITPIPRMTYQEAMSDYGSDKPDLRYSAKVSITVSRSNSKPTLLDPRSHETLGD